MRTDGSRHPGRRRGSRSARALAVVRPWSVGPRCRPCRIGDTPRDARLMHELALSEAIADTVAARAGSRPVTEARVRIGFLRQVVPEALTFAWAMVTDGTALDGCELVIEHVPAAVACRPCAAHSVLAVPILVCGA